MTARILVVDDIEANVRLLEAKLTAEYYEVLTASDGPTALAMAAAEQPDIILLDVMMPGMDGFEVCRRLKDDPVTRHIPVVLVTALDGRADRIAGLEAGRRRLPDQADRRRHPVRPRAQPDAAEAGDRRTARARGLGPPHGRDRRRRRAPGRLRRPHADRRRQRAPGPAHRRPSWPSSTVRWSRPIRRRRCSTARGPVDLVIVNAARQELRRPALRRPAALRRGHPPPADPGHRRPRRPAAAGQGAGDRRQRHPARARSIREELAARVRTQIQRKRYTDFLRNNLDHSLELAVTDQLTGLHNRRYMAGQLEALVRRAGAGRRAGGGAADRHRPLQDRSTTASATTSATRCCASSPCAWPPTSAPSTCRAATAARSSWWSCPTPRWRTPSASPSASACTWPARRSASWAARSC